MKTPWIIPQPRNHVDIGNWLDDVFAGNPEAAYQGDSPEVLDAIAANPLALAFYQHLFQEKMDPTPKRRRSKQRVTRP